MPRTAGLDVGDKTIGVALSDPRGRAAPGGAGGGRPGAPGRPGGRGGPRPPPPGPRGVVGLPRNMNGTYGPRAELARQFAADLEAASGLPVLLADERLTTVQAQRTLLAGDASRARRRQVIDMLAAQLILQGVLDREAARP